MTHPKDALAERVAIARGWVRHAPCWVDHEGRGRREVPPISAGELLEEIAGEGHSVRLDLTGGSTSCIVWEPLFGAYGTRWARWSHGGPDAPQAIAEAWLAWKEDQDAMDTK